LCLQGPLNVRASADSSKPFAGRYTSSTKEAASRPAPKGRRGLSHESSTPSPERAQRTGSTIDWKLFNKDGDNTSIIIMTPHKSEYRGDPEAKTTKMTEIMYHNKIQEIIKVLIQPGHIPDAAAIAQAYVWLNYSWDRKKQENVGKDAANIDKTERGIARSQHDGDSHYRIWYEYMMYTSEDRVAG
jgi:hypothetical protein